MRWNELLSASSSWYFFFNLWFWVFRGMIQLRNLKWNHTYWIFSPFSSRRVHYQQTHLICSMSLWNLTQLPIEPCHPTHRWTMIFCIEESWMLIPSVPNELRGNLYIYCINKWKINLITMLWNWNSKASNFPVFEQQNVIPKCTKYLNRKSPNLFETRHICTY